MIPLIELLERTVVIKEIGIRSVVVAVEQLLRKGYGEAFWSNGNSCCPARDLDPPGHTI